MEKMSPMMTQYLKTKSEYSDCILFYRLGDFYEMFFDDALLVSKELELTLTGKDCGMSERAPMCGVPYHAVDVYIDKLIKNGHKVAIAEQLEDPKLAKGLVKRDVIRVVTPGTVLAGTSLDETKNNYLMCIVYTGSDFGMSIVDITTGEYLTTDLKDISEIRDELFRFSPSEIIANEYLQMSGLDLEELRNRIGFAYSTLSNKYFDDITCYKALCKHFHVANLTPLGIETFPNGIIASGALLQYLYETQKNEMPQLTSIKPYTTGKYMILDTATRRNLELTETMREKQKRGTLLWVLDKTKTAMGARLLRQYVEQPLVKRDEIVIRQDAIEELCENYIDREELREYLQPIYDLERLIGRVSYKSANPKDLIALKNSLEMLPAIGALISKFKSQAFVKCTEEFDALEDLYALIDASINDDPPMLVHDGGIIKPGYSEETDMLRRSKTEGKDWLADLEATERDKTGIKGLKIKFNKVFGYYFEVTNSFKDLVPDYFERKQTLVGAERYTTPRLKELENIILGADDRLKGLEYDLFSEVRDKLADEVVRVQKTAHAVALIDVFCSLSLVAQRNNYVRPKINEKGIIKIRDGRHPVVELMLHDDLFVANDVLLDNHNNRISIITGPNMAGKSTYMRQVALITLMAQLGSFVPAAEADISLCDRIFTRVGASDDLASGQSTFMVEMAEVSNILRNATKNSLIVLDEIGRGTSTYDGMSIAWAVVEFISDPKQIGAKTLFATHYHELTELEGAIPGVVNYCIAVREQGDNIIFLRKIIKGGADKSYGIQVAKLAGVPDKVVQRAKELVEQLTDADIAVKTKELAQTGAVRSPKRVVKADEVDANQLTLFDTVREEDILEELEKLNIGQMTPMDALNTLYNWQNKLKNRMK
ncbi:MAG: DNA mismatch repair protein MutS [Lachnospiraceae bacterium]|nr:DNA mismatch repair protein MutS [Lachnospiraceae bacterium]